jgi:hypothetical protein
LPHPARARMINYFSFITDVPVPRNEKYSACHRNTVDVSA